MTLFCHYFAFLYICPIMHVSFGSSSSASLHIGGRPIEGSESGQVGGGFGGLPSTAVRAPLEGHPPSAYQG